ncbi:Protein dispatched [Dirofilaria immitis]
MVDNMVDNNGIIHHLLSYYSIFLFNYPGTILIIISILSTIIPLTVIFLNPLQINQNPETGFETRDTEYSGPRLTWDKVSWNLQMGNRVVLSNMTNNFKNRLKRSWADELLNTFSQVACYETAIPGMDYLTQFIVEANSYDDLFDLDYLKMLCSLHFHLNDQIQLFANITPYRNIWSLPNYLSCLSPNFLTNCSFLTEYDVQSARDIIDYCRSYRHEIINCRRDCYLDCPQCSNVPKDCSNQMIFDIFYRILPKNLNAKPIYINGYLPIFTSSGYRSQGFYNGTIERYLNLQNALRNFSTQHRKFVLKGLSMDIKRDILYDGAKRDSILACGAAFSVFLIVFFYSLNIFYCITVAFVLFASVLCALAIYSLFTVDFPLLNLVIFVLLLAVGSDDAFVLLNSFPTDVTSQSIHQCLSHTASAMLLTSSSTAVPFFTNILSSVVVFRCFGLFAGITLIFNYLLEISLLPAMLIFHDRYIQRCCCCCFPSSWHIFSKLNYLMRDLLPYVIVSGRYIWISSLTAIVAAMTYLTYVNLQFPPYNPLQLFVDSNEHEWYDNNAEKNFEFVAKKLQIPIAVRLIWGLTPRTSQSVFQLDKLTAVQHDSRFVLQNITDIQELALKLHGYRELKFINHESQYWPERYLTWSRNFTCKPAQVCCNFADAKFQQNFTDYCIRLSTTYLYTNYNDTPIYDNGTFELVGYTAMIPTELKYSHRFKNLSHSFDLLRHSFSNMNHGGWYTTEWSLISVWYDLLNSIITDCRQSLIISFSVVAIFAFLHLRLKSFAALFTICCIVIVTVGCVTTLGWVIGVLEAIILVLVVGLSFDFTLHYGASIPNIGCNKHRIWLAARKSAIPVSLSALSSFAAGSSMLIAETHAFRQVGEFLVTLASVSWIFATFFFLPLLSFTLRSNVDCELCREVSRQINLPMNEKSTFM